MSTNTSRIAKIERPSDGCFVPDHFREWVSMTMKPRAALFVDDSVDETRLIVEMSKDFNIQWEVCHTREMALDKLTYKKYQLIVLDLNLGNGERDGVTLFRDIKKLCPMCPTLILSGHISNETIVDITKIGFAMFAQKPTVFDSNFFEQLFMALNIPRVGENQIQPEPKVIQGDNI